jgi:hypothetical protein
MYLEMLIVYLRTQLYLLLALPVYSYSHLHVTLWCTATSMSQPECAHHAQPAGDTRPNVPHYDTTNDEQSN